MIGGVGALRCLGAISMFTGDENSRPSSRSGRVGGSLRINVGLGLKMR
jgi:hypothetical protein